MREIFKVDKPIIGVVHLPPLPGSPKHTLPIEKILERALKDAKTYSDGGIDGIIIENFGDVPFYPDKVGPETIAAMTHVASRVEDAIDIPIGIQVLRNDAEASLSIAKIVGGKFIRINILCEAMVTDQGIIQPRAYDIQRFRKFIGAENIKIFADVHVKHAAPLAERDIGDSAEDLVYRSLADAIIVTGVLTGKQTDIRKVEKIKSRKSLANVPVLVGGGVHRGNVEEYLPFCDGIIIGTSLKVNEITTNPVDPQKVKEFMKKVNEIR
jgi:membrane complex biogenesis BtpA family protein